jgi:hypothetical protein
MPKLIQEVIGNIYDPELSEVKYVFPIASAFGEGDYIDVFAYKFYLQNYSRVEDEIVDIPTPINFGMVSNNNRVMITVEKSY